MTNNQITSQCCFAIFSKSARNLLRFCGHSECLSCVLWYSWTKLSFFSWLVKLCMHWNGYISSSEGCSSSHIFFLPKLFRISCSFLPNAAHFSGVPQPSVPSVMPFTPVCNLFCSTSHEHFYQHH